MLLSLQWKCLFSQVHEFLLHEINFLQNCSISLLFVCDWLIRSEMKSNWITGTGKQEVDQFSIKTPAQAFIPPADEKRYSTNSAMNTL